MAGADGFDAVVVGSGPNGLVGAVILAEAGLRVLLVEQADEVGGGLRSGPLTGLDGFTHDLCATVLPLARASAAFREPRPRPRLGLPSGAGGASAGRTGRGPDPPGRVADRRRPWVAPGRDRLAAERRRDRERRIRPGRLAALAAVAAFGAAAAGQVRRPRPAAGQRAGPDPVRRRAGAGGPGGDGRALHGRPAQADHRRVRAAAGRACAPGRLAAGPRRLGPARGRPRRPADRARRGRGDGAPGARPGRRPERRGHPAGPRPRAGRRRLR